MNYEVVFQLGKNIFNYLNIESDDIHKTIGQLLSQDDIICDPVELVKPDQNTAVYNCSIKTEKILCVFWRQICQ